LNQFHKWCANLQLRKRCKQESEWETKMQFPHLH
jgi:hypothetical protein